MTYFGQYAEVTTPAFSYAVQAVQPLTGESGLQRGHADVDVTLRKEIVGLHGLLGQSFQNVASEDCPGDYRFHGDGQEGDYILPELSSQPSSRALTILKTSRKLIETEEAFYPITVHLRS